MGLLSLILCVLSLVSVVKGGRWINVDVTYNYKNGYDFGYEPIDRKFIRGELKACYSMEVIIMDNTNWDNYVYYQLYYYSSYTAMLDGGSYKTWDYGQILDCYQWKPFWFAWDGNTQSMGMGLIPGENTYLSYDFGRVVTANILKVAAGVVIVRTGGKPQPASSITGETSPFQLWKCVERSFFSEFPAGNSVKNDLSKPFQSWKDDEPPLFVAPSPDGNEVLELSESLGQYSVVYTPSGTDEESDTIEFLTEDQNTDYFAVYYGYLYLMKNLDYETQKKMLVTFKAKCDYNYAKNTMLVRVKNEIDVVPAITVHSITIPEMMEVGHPIGRAFTVVDEEEDDYLTYSISGSHQEYLDIDSSTGYITVKKLMDADTTNFDFSGLTMTATDTGGNKASAAFDLTIYDINDNTPVFSQENYEVTVDDGVSSGAILTITVNDADFDNQGITTYIVSQDPTADFSISGDVISVTATLDYESLASMNFQYVLVLYAVDNPYSGAASTGTGCVVIKIAPINEHTPGWVSTPSGTTISEGAADLSIITTLTATDSDLGEDGRITYLIDSVTPNSGTDLFTVDSETGEVKVGGHLDFDTGTGGVGSYTVVVSAADNGPTPKAIHESIVITLTGVNDNAPIFDQTEYVVNDFNEGSVTTLLQPVMTDHDGDTVTLTIISGNSGGQFSIDGHTVKVVSALDYETQQRHSIVLRASDGVHTTDAAVTINVKDIIDENPVITVVSSTPMSEEQTIGTRVSGGFVATDPDVSDTLTYSISGAGSTYLNIDSSNGELTVADNVDYESIQQFQFTVTVTDMGGNTDSQAVTINVDDINDKFPTCSPSVYEVTVTENSAADLSLLDFNCGDADTGNSAVFDLSIASGDGGTGVFKISGQQLLTASTPVDFETLETKTFLYTLVIAAVDKPDHGLANTGSALVKITVGSENEFFPVWTNPASDGSGNFNGVSITEGDAPGTLVTTFQASDQDLGLDGVVTYYLKAVGTASGGTSLDTFGVDLGTGELTVRGPLDCDAGTNGEASYTVRVRATDLGTNPDPKWVDGVIVVTVTNINDNPPYFDQTDYSADVPEDAAVTTDVITITAQDHDLDTVTLSLVSGDTSHFELDTATNSIKVKTALNYEVQPVHILVIRASDGLFETDVSLQINIVDVIDETPVITMKASASMSEEQALGTCVYGGYVVTDDDAGDTLTYTLSGADSSYLTIDSATGELSTAQNVNREGTGGKTQLDLTLTVTDSAGLQASQNFKIDVEDINDLAPVFNPSEFTAEITENSAADLSLTDLTCTDDDAGDNALFDVMVASGDGGAGVFKMSGLQLQTDSNPPDYEALGSSGFMYTLIITAVDKPTQGEPNTGTAIVRVTVKPENEYTPVFINAIDGSRYFDGATVSEGDPPGTVVDAFTATDSDLGDDGEVSYSIVSVTGASGSTPTDKFSIDSSTGELIVAGALDVDSGTNGEASYTVVIRASDKGTSSLYVEGSIVVTLTNINDNPPTFDKTDYSADISEASAVGSVVITINTADLDGDSVSLSVLSGGNDHFQCNGNDVTIKNSLDYETDTFHVLKIRASDGVFNTDVPLIVYVLDASDEVPQITMVTSATMSEEQAIGTGVYGGYLATDADAGDTLSYSLGGADSSYLTVDSSTGILSTVDHVDRETKSQLDLTLTVTDGVLSNTKDFTITVEDINDSPSIFSPSEYTAVVTENTGSDDPLLDLTCSDVDLGNNAVFDVAVASGDGGAGVFKMAGLQLLTSGTPADYESVVSTGFMYTLVITATDRPDHGVPNTGSAIVRVTVRPENEYSPVWTAPSSDGSGNFDALDVNEDAPTGVCVATFQASDSDEGMDGDVTYSIVSITSDTTGASVPKAFYMEAASGRLEVGGKLDRDLDTGGHVSYTVVVRASDGHATPNTVEGTVVITPNNVNDNPPSFTASQYQADISEDSAVGTTVLTLSYEDYDADSVTLSVEGGRSDLFVMDGNDLKVNAALDYEMDTHHVVVVRANDGIHDVDVSVEINVLDVLDESPVITMIATSPVAEEQTIGTAVDGGYVVTDADAGDSVTYSLSGADSGYLTIDSATGGLTFNQNLDREAGVTSLSLALTVTDQGGLQATEAFTMSVEDIDDEPPIFNPSEYTVEVDENTAADTSLLDLTCNDRDTGNNALFVVSVANGDDSPSKFKFSGLQLQTDSTPIDYDTAAGLHAQESGYMYTLIVTAVDTPDQGDPNTGTAVIKVKVKPINEHTPVWTAPDASGTSGVAVSEDVVPGTVVETFQASDEDRGNDGVVTYSIMSVTGDTTGNNLLNLFAVDPSTGELKVENKLDSDLKTGGEASYTIVVRASDNGEAPKFVDGTIVVTQSGVNDNAPVFSQSKFQVDIREDSAVGTVGITIDCEDHDGDSVTLTIISGGDDFFKIDGSDVQVKAVLDFETQSYYVLFIKATDGTFETEVSLQIDIVDVIDEKPVITMVTTSSVAEEQTIGTAVYGGYSVTDPDAQDSLTYSLTGADSTYFSIDAATGDLTTAKNLDREGTSAKTSLHLTLTVTDQAGLQDTQDFTITVEDINDLAPIFSPFEYTVEVTENTAADTELLQLSCKDDDSGNNAIYSVALIDGDDTATKFKLADLKLLTDVNQLDFETLEEYTLIITAVDTPDQGDPNTGTAVVKVTVKSANEYTPGWTSPDSSGVFEVTIAEDTKSGSIVTTYSATDNDNGVDGDITYSIVSVTAASGASANTLFDIDSCTGELLIARQLDSDTGTNGEASYEVFIKAEDGGTTSKSVEGTVTIILTNVNDNAPVFDQVSYQTSVEEGKDAGTVIITLATEDYDGDAVTLSVASGRTDLFECSGNDVRVRTNAIDFENEKFYVLIIRATDGVHDTDVPLHIKVVNVYDEPPVITMVTTASMAEEQAIETPVYGGYSVSDPDVVDVLTYTISGADSSFVDIDSTGELTLAQHVDREGLNAKSQLDLTLTVTDIGGLQATQDFTITVEDINDLTPVFAQRYYEIEVTENTAADTELLDLVCTDGDAGQNAAFTVGLLSGDDTTPKFKIFNSKLLTETNPIDYESLKESCYTYLLIVTAVDTPDQGVANTGTAVVKVTVRPENDFNPQWTAPSSDGANNFNGVHLDEDVKLGTLVTTFQASDDDHSNDGLVSYSIVSVTGDTSKASLPNLFSIDSSTGKLLVAEQLDSDEATGGEDSYTIAVRASDSGTSPFTIDGTIVITLNSVNDNAPYFLESEFEADVSEDATVGTRVIGFGKRDPDKTEPTYTIVSGRSDIFELDGADMNLKAGLDYESGKVYLLFVKASDGKFETTVSLKVNVIDVIDETPVITMIGTGTMSEGQMMGTGVRGGYRVTDADAQDELSYALSGTHSHYLKINATTGDLTASGDLVDRDGTSGVTELTDLTLTVTDLAGLQATQAFTIKVVDINDITPTFNPAEYAVEVTENMIADTSLLDLTCTDDDEGKNAEFDVTIGGGDEATPKFKLVGLQLQTESTPIDYETLKDNGYKFTLFITAVDKPQQGDPNTGTAVVTVTVKPENEHSPEWTDPSNDGSSSDGSRNFDYIPVDEDSVPGYVLTTFTATDADHGADGTVTYSIISVTGDTTGASLPNLFSMDASTGKLKIGGELDRDLATGGEAHYTVVVKASDNGATPNVVNGTIIIRPRNINDNAPYFDKSEYQANVDEDSAVGTVVIALGTEDPDNDAMALSIVSGGNDHFVMDGNDVKVNAILDFETESHYVHVIRVSDGKFEANVSLEITLVDVIDEKPVITLVGALPMSEEQTVGTGVNGGYVVTDADAGDILTYALSGPDSSYFTINSTTGELTVVNAVEREGANAKTSLSLTLTVTDKAGLQATKDFTIPVEDINDLPPSCDPAVFSAEVPENSPQDLMILDLTCADYDYGNNAVFSVSIGSGDDTNPKFKMSGKQLMTTNTPIDYESLDSTGFLYTLIITAVDGPDQGNANTGTAVVKVKVTPINEHAPEWVDQSLLDSNDYLADVTVDEDAPPGTVITTVSATDNDMSEDGKIRYEVTSIILDDGSDATGTFVIGYESGELQVKSELDAESSVYYDVSIRVVDGGNPSKNDTLGIKVYVNNVNDLPPSFSEDKYTTVVDEDTAIETVIFDLTATDPDGDTLTYAIDGGSTDMFECRDSTIVLLKKLDFETKRYHSLTITASDNGVHVVRVSLIINVNNVMDEAPVIKAVDHTLPEGLLTGTILGDIFTLEDADPDDVFKFELSGENADMLDIDPTTGAVSIKQPIDSDSGISVLDKVTITATDKGGQSTHTDLSFTIKDVNDNVPTFSNTSHEVTIDESGSGDITLTEFEVKDADPGENGDFDLRILSGDDLSNPKFSLVGMALHVDTSRVDYEELTAASYKYTLTIAAVDKPLHGQALTGSTLVTVKVTSKNEFSPEWVDPLDDTFSNITVPELTKFGTVIANFTATDGDAGLDGDIKYNIQSVTDSNGNKTSSMFGILTMDQVGQVFLAAQLDADVETGGVPFYELVIIAHDNGVISKSITGTIVVNVEDEYEPVPTETSATVDAETWALRGSLMATGAGLGVAGILAAKHLMQKIKLGKKPPAKLKPKFERNRAHDDEMTVEDLDDMFAESIVPGDKVRPPR